MADRPVDLPRDRLGKGPCGALTKLPRPGARLHRLRRACWSPSDWRAVPVGPNWSEDADSDTRRPPLLRRAFIVPGPPTRARLYVTAHGVCEIEINGQRVGNDAMAPGWTVYQSRLRYFTYDVSDFITEGENAMGAWLGDGWYRGRLGWNGGFRNIYGADISLIAQLEVRDRERTIPLS